MSVISKLLERSFENKGNKNRYSAGQWSIAFNERVWDTRFELYYNNVCVLEGNTLDKQLKITNSDAFPLEKLIREVEKGLPEYRFDIQLSMLLPVDFNFEWEKEIEGAEYIGNTEEVRFEDISEGIGYDVALFSVPRLSDLENVRIEEEDHTVYKIHSFDMRLVQDGAIEVCPTCFTPVTQMDLESKIKAAESSVSKISSAEINIDRDTDVLEK